MSRNFIKLGLLGLLLAAGSPAQAQADEVESAQELVRVHYFEGLPYARARRLTPTGVEALIEILEDPAEAEYHENVVMALGISGDPQAYRALSRFHASTPEGEVGGAAYRARRAIPLAMGHLARRDERAYRFLVKRVHATTSPRAPAWRYRHLSGDRLAGILRRAAITGVAISGRPEASADLGSAEARTRADSKATDELRRHIRESRKLSDRVTREGPDRVFGADLSP